ncbi:hypothetical protein [Streptomyces sp. NBC_00637]|uniref:hypothetical protein n=1 Tax=Streptomyces sp. NBC_00637 TaxID=2903667 RepID=UPI003862DB1B
MTVAEAVAVPAAGAVVAGAFGAAVVVEGGATVGFGAAVVFVGAGGVVTFEMGALGFFGAGAAVAGGVEGEAVAVGVAVRASRARYPSQDVSRLSVRCPSHDVFFPSVQNPLDVAVTASDPASVMHAMAADGTATAPIASTATTMGRRRVFLRCFR